MEHLAKLRPLFIAQQNALLPVGGELEDQGPEDGNAVYEC